MICPSLYVCMCVSVTLMIPFGRDTRTVPSNDVLDGPWSPHRKGRFGGQYPQMTPSSQRGHVSKLRIRGFLNDMRYINLFYLLTYLIWPLFFVGCVTAVCSLATWLVRRSSDFVLTLTGCVTAVLSQVTSLLSVVLTNGALTVDCNLRRGGK